MGIIKEGVMSLGDKKLRVKIFGYEGENNKFIETDVWVSKMDLDNIGILDAYQEKAE